MKVLRGSRGDATGTESGSSSVERIIVNTGTIPVLPNVWAACTHARLGAPTADRAGMGRSHRSTSSRGKPGTWGRVAAVSRKEDTAMPKDAVVNIVAPGGTGPMGPFARVSGMQTKLHRWAAADQGRGFDDLFNLV